MRIDPLTVRLLSTLDLGYANLILACDRIDRIRDSIVTPPDPIECNEVVEFLITTMNGVRELEDLSLMPALETAAAANPAYAAIFRRLSHEHCEDACYLEEIIETLASFGHSSPFIGPVAAKFMLGGFTTGLRRHLATERFVVSQWLTPSEDEDWLEHRRFGANVIGQLK